MNSKTFAIITDVHSNLASLKKALNLIDQRSDVNQVICLGDYFALGPEPEATLVELKRINNCIFIRGNHDRYLIEKLWESESPSLEGMDPNDPICQAIVGNEKWTAELLGKEGHDFCSETPSTLLFLPLFIVLPIVMANSAGRGHSISNFPTCVFSGIEI